MYKEGDACAGALCAKLPCMQAAVLSTTHDKHNRMLQDASAAAMTGVQPCRCCCSR
jgi:hypothetical protein